MIRSSPIKRSHQTSKHAGSCFACNVTLTDAYINLLCTNYASNHANPPSYQSVEHACLGRRSRSLARRSSRLRHLFRNLWYSENVHYRENHRVHKSCSKFFPNKYYKKLDKNIRLTEKESIKKHLLFKRYKGFSPRTNL